MQKEMIIKRSTIKLALGVLGSLLFVMVGILLLYTPKMEYMSYAVINILGIIFFSIAVLTFIYVLFFRMHTPILILNEEGYIYNGKYFVWWGQVKDIQTLNVDTRYRGMKFIRVELKSIKSIPIENSKLIPYTHKSKKTNRYMTTVLNSLIGEQQTKMVNEATTMDLDISLSNYKIQKVIEIMKQYKAEYDRIHQGKKINNDD